MQRFVKSVSTSTLTLSQNLSQLNPSFTPDLSQLNPNFTPDLSQLNPNFTPDLSQLNPNFNAQMEFRERSRPVLEQGTTVLS